MDTKGLQERCHPTWDDDEIGVVLTEQPFGVVGLVTTEHIQDKHAPLSGETAIWLITYYFRPCTPNPEPVPHLSTSSAAHEQ